MDLNCLNISNFEGKVLPANLTIYKTEQTSDPSNSYLKTYLYSQNVELKVEEFFENHFKIE